MALSRLLWYEPGIRRPSKGSPALLLTDASLPPHFLPLSCLDLTATISHHLTAQINPRRHDVGHWDSLRHAHTRVRLLSTTAASPITGRQQAWLTRQPAVAVRHNSQAAIFLSVLLTSWRQSAVSRCVSHAAAVAECDPSCGCGIAVRLSVVSPRACCCVW